MSEDRKLTVGIDTPANLTGLAAAEKAIAELKQKVDELTAAMGKEGEGHEKAAKHAEHHISKHKILHTLAHGLNEIIPGLGNAMMVAFSPVGGALMIAAGAAKIFHEHMKEVNEQFKKAEEELAKPLTKTLDAQRDSFIEGTQKAAAFNTKLGEAARGEQTMKQKTEEAVAALKVQVSETGKLEEALKKNEQVQLDILHDAGLMSETTYLGKKIALEEKYIERKRALEEREMMTEILVKRRAIEIAEEQQSELEEKAAEAREKSERAHVRVASIIPLEERKANKEKADAALKEWETGIHAGFAKDEMLTQFGAMGSGLTQGQAELYSMEHATQEHPYVSGIGKYYLEWDNLKREVESADAQLKPKQLASIARVKVEADAADRQLERAEERSIKNREFITEEKRGQNIREATFTARKETNKELSKEGVAAGRGEFEQKLLGTPEGQRLSAAQSSYDTWTKTRRPGQQLPPDLVGLYTQMFQPQGGAANVRQGTLDSAFGGGKLLTPESYARLKAEEDLATAIRHVTQGGRSRDALNEAAADLSKEYSMSQEAMFNMIRQLVTNAGQMRAAVTVLQSQNKGNQAVGH